MGSHVMGVRTVIAGQVAAILIVFSLGLPTPSEAVVFWEEDFENHLTPNWNTAACGTPAPQDGCNAQISTTLPHSGAHSLKSYYSTLGHPAGTYYDRSVTATGDLWMRFYYRTVNFTYDPQGNIKLFFNFAQGINVIWINVYGNRSMQALINHPQPVTCPNGYTDETCTYYANVKPIPLNDNQWYCLETHANAGTPGVANGMIELYVDGVKSLSHSNLLITTTSSSFNTVRHYTQYGFGYRYVDDLAVGNTRIGCGVSPRPSSDVTPPATPIGLSVR